MKLRLTVLLVAAHVGFLVAAGAQPKSSDHWVATWATAETLVRTPPPAAPAAAPSAAAPRNAPVGAQGFHNQTVRMTARVSIGGRRLRVKIANAFGAAPLAVGAAHIALRGKDSEIVAASDHALSFAGKPGCAIGPGVVMISDPVDMTVAPLAELSVSLYFPGETGPPAGHSTGLHYSYIKEGDTTGEVSMADAQKTQQYYWLAGSDVLAPAGAAAIVAFGDSITDGARSDTETNHSWPALLGARLAANRATAQIGVANMGIGGNRVLRDITGASALARFDRDVLSQSGVKWVMILEGINDIGHAVGKPDEAVTAEELIAGHKMLIEMAHAHGIRAIGCTLIPYEGAGYSRENGEAVREALNTWIRTSGAYDAVVDFEAATRDPANPKRIRPEFDPGDHLHPNNLGYEAMANAVDLSLFGGKKK